MAKIVTRCQRTESVTNYRPIGLADLGIYFYRYYEHPVLTVSQAMFSSSLLLDKMALDIFASTDALQTPTPYGDQYTAPGLNLNSDEKEIMPTTSPHTVVLNHAHTSQLSVEIIRRTYYDYIHPMLPILAHHTLSKLFAGTLPYSTFHTFLGAVLVAATAPFLGPELNFVFRRLHRDEVIDEYYHKAKVRRCRHVMT